MLLIKQVEVIFQTFKGNMLLLPIMFLVLEMVRFNHQRFYPGCSQETFYGQKNDLKLENKYVGIVSTSYGAKTTRGLFRRMHLVHLIV